VELADVPEGEIGGLGDDVVMWLEAQLGMKCDT